MIFLIVAVVAGVLIFALAQTGGGKAMGEKIGRNISEMTGGLFGENQRMETDNVHFYFTARRLFGSSCVFYRQTLDFAAEIGHNMLGYFEKEGVSFPCPSVLFAFIPVRLPRAAASAKGKRSFPSIERRCSIWSIINISPRVHRWKCAGGR